MVLTGCLGLMEADVVFAVKGLRVCFEGRCEPQWDVSCEVHPSAQSYSLSSSCLCRPRECISYKLNSKNMENVVKCCKMYEFSFK